jgi:hypothetical protein
MRYQLTLPKGAIKRRGTVYIGSHTDMIWSPVNPEDNGGWKNGDILSVTCSFNLNPDVNPKPPSYDYGGLCAGACNSGDSSAVAALIRAAKNLPLRTTGVLLNSGMTTNTTPASDNIFYGATYEAATFHLERTYPNNKTLVNYKYHWEMIFNGANTVADGENVEIVFGYGDPMESDGKS